MTSPTLVYRHLTIDFARSVKADSLVPQAVQVIITPLATATSGPADATLVEAPAAQEVLLSTTTTSVVFGLVPTDLSGLTERVLYRVAWRIGGPTGRTFTYDFAMPDADISFEQIANLGYIIDGEVYLQQADLGKPGRVARLDDNGDVIDALGVPVATNAAITALAATLTTEVGNRQTADTAVRDDLTLLVTDRFNQAQDALDDVQQGLVNSVDTERYLRIAGDTTLGIRVDNLSATTAAKADLVAGKVPLNEIPDGVRIQGVSVANQAAMLALTSSQVQQFDYALPLDGSVWLLAGTNPAVLGNWVKLNLLTSVNGHTGAVSLSLTDVAAQGGTLPQNQVAGLTASFAAKADLTALSTLAARVTAIEGDATLVHTSGGVIPHTLNDSSMAYVDVTGTRVIRKDGTLIGSVLDVNGSTGHVTVNLTGAAAQGGTVPQAQVTGLVTALAGKLSATDPSVTNARTPTPHAASHAAGGSDSLTLTTAQVTGLATTLGTYGGRITSLEGRVGSLESGGGVASLTRFAAGSPTGNFAANLTLYSPFGYNPANPAANVAGYYYDPAGAPTSEARYPYLTPNGHLKLVKWNEAAAADPVYATQTNLDATNAAVATKAAQSGLDATNATVATKAAQADLTTLAGTVSGLVTPGMLASAVAAKADASALSSLVSTVSAKANASDLATTNANLVTLTSTVGTKADLVAGKVPLSQMPTIIGSVVSVNGLSGIVTLTASTVGALPNDGTATVDIAHVTGLTAALAGKADTGAVSAQGAVKPIVDYVVTTATSLSGQQRSDGGTGTDVLMALGSTCLVTNQASSVNNGIYTVNAGAWTRTADMAAASSLNKGTVVVVNSGTNAKTLWQAAASATVASGANNWTKIGSVSLPYAPTGGNGISITGTYPTQTITAVPKTGGGLVVDGTGLYVDTTLVARKFTAPITTGTPGISIVGTLVTVTHNLGSSTPVVSVVDSTGVAVLVGWQATTDHTVVIEFGSTVVSGSWRVTVIA